MGPRRLSHSPVWQIPRELQRHAADLASHCSNVLASFVDHQPPSVVGNILFLNCRNGEFAFLILRTLVQVLSSKLDSFIFIVTDPSRENVLACQSYFQRRNLANFKNLEFSVFDAEYDTDCRFLSGRRFKPGPTAVIAESFLLDYLRFDVFLIRDGELHEGLVQIDSCRQWEPDLEDKEFLTRSRVKVNFRPVAPSRMPYYTGKHEPLNTILHQAREEGRDGFCVPVGAVNAFLNVLHMTQGNLMLLAIDDCPNLLQYSCESLRKSLGPAVSALGGSFLTNGMSPNSVLIWFGETPSDVITAFTRIVGDGSVPDLQCLGLKANLLTALWLLEHSHFDPDVFARVADRLRYSDASDALKDRLCNALLNVFERRFSTTASHCLAIGRCLMDLKLWEQACTVWESVIDECPNMKLTASYFLAVCYKNIGRLDDAGRTIDHSLERRPFDEKFRQLKLELMMAK